MYNCVPGQINQMISFLVEKLYSGFLTDLITTLSPKMPLTS